MYDFTYFIFIIVKYLILYSYNIYGYTMLANLDDIQ